MHNWLKRIASAAIAVMTVAMMIPTTTLTTVAANKVIYVSPSGSDSGNGSISSPYKTIAKAKEAVKSLNTNNAGGVTVYLRGGDYTVDTTISFNAADSGSRGNPVVYAAYPGETVNIIGGSKVNSAKITKASTAVSSRVLNTTAASKLMQIDLKSEFPDGIPKYQSYGNDNQNAYNPKVNHLNEYAFQLYCGDVALSRSRWPNADASYPYVKATNKAIKADGKAEAGAGYTYYFDGDTAARVNKWSSCAGEDLFVHGFWAYEYNTEDCTVRNLNPASKSMTIVGGLNAGDWKTAGTDTYVTKPRFYFFNLPEEIDQPGECYIDYSESIVYFYPPDNFNSNSVYFSRNLSAMFGIYSGHDITFDGLNFKYNRGDMIDIRTTKDVGYSATTMEQYRGISIKNCTFKHGSHIAIEAYGTDVNIDQCEFDDFGNGVIRMYGGNKKGLISGNSSITNCVISNFNRNEHTYDPAIEPASVGLKISHNHISGGIHQAIGSYSFSNNVVIEYNEFDHLVTECFDMGAIYYGRDLTVWGTVIRYNYFHDIGSQYTSSMQHAIYIDDGAPGADIYGNVFYRASSRDYEPAAIKLHAAQFSSIHNNVFVDMPYAVEDAAWAVQYQKSWIAYVYNTDYGLYGPLKANLFDTGIWKSTYQNTIWAQMYNYVTTAKIDAYTKAPYTGDKLPDAAVTNSALPYLTNSVTGNVICNISKGLVYDVWKPNANVKASQNYTGSTSIFTNYGSDFSLTASGLSAVKGTIPGFTNIPFSSIGPVSSCTHTPGAAATCTTAQICTKCNRVLVAAYGHNYVNGKCTRCQAVDPTYEPPHTHSLQAVAAKNATCQSEGNMAYWRCTICQKVFLNAAGTVDTSISTVIVPKLSHPYASAWSFDKNAHWHACTTCGDKGSYAVHTMAGGKCSVCGYMDHAHVVTAVAAKAATCIEDGCYAHYRCTICSAVFLDANGKIEAAVSTVTIPKLGHDLSSSLTSDVSGHWYACSRCSFKDSFSAHTMVSGKCSICGYLDHAHKIEAVPAKTATCREAGCYAHYCCTICQKVFLDGAGKIEASPETVTIAKKSHTFGTSWTTDTNGHYYACTACGERKDYAAHTMVGGKCSTCGYTAHTHSIVSVAAKKATCEEAGCYAHYECSSCHAIFLDAAGKMEVEASTVTIAKLQNHTFSEAWQSDDSGHYHVCTACGAKGSVESHKMADGKCSVCGYGDGGDTEGKATDFTGDGTVDSDDVIFLLSHTMRPDLFPIPSGISVDYNGDGGVDSDDAIYLLSYLMRPDLFPLRNS